MIDEEYARLLTGYLQAIGHINIDYVTNIYEEGQYGFYEGTNIPIPATTYIEYVDLQGRPTKSPLDLNIREINKAIVIMPKVELPPTEPEE